MTYAYFLSGLLASFLLVLSLFVILIMMLRKNWNHANRWRLSFLAPIIMVVLIVYFSMTELIPRTFDLLQVATRRYEVMEIDMRDVKLGRSSLIADERSYHFMPGSFHESAKGRYQISFTRHTRFVIHITSLGESLEDSVD